MIKTVPFAPPRPRKKQSQALRVSGSPASENPVATRKTRHNTASRSTRNTLTTGDSPTVSNLLPLTIPVPAKSTKAKSAKVEPQGELTLAFDFDSPDPVPAPAKAAPTRRITAAKAIKPGAEMPKPAVKKVEPTKPEPAKAEATVAVTEKPVEASLLEAPKKTAAPKARKVRVPVNLAEQYGAKPSKRIESGAVEIPVEDAPKKRLTKAEREARKQLLRPDEGLMERLQRAANITPTKKPARAKGWKFDCGRCGRTSYFQTPNAAICECGAIAVKE